MQASLCITLLYVSCISLLQPLAILLVHKGPYLWPLLTFLPDALEGFILPLTHAFVDVHDACKCSMAV